jgi:ribosome biogenesis GTPase
VVSGLDGDFNPRRIERYLLLAWESGAKPVVVLNKADACIDVAEAAGNVSAWAADAPVLVVSALEAWGLPAPEAHLKCGGTAALAGSSGAGKSTLVNRLLGREQQRVQAVRIDDSGGRHNHPPPRVVSRTRQLACSSMPPGLRELQLWVPIASMPLFPTSPPRLRIAAFATAAIKVSPAAPLPRRESTRPRLVNYSKMQAH